MNIHDNLIELLKYQARTQQCAQCQENMQSCRIRILAEQGHRALVRITCTKCNAEFLVQVIFQVDDDEDEEQQPMRPTIDEGYPEKYEPISADELLEVHNFLNQKDLDFRVLAQVGKNNPEESPE